MLYLKVQHFGHLMRRTDLLEEILMLGKIEGKRRRGRQRMTQLDTDGHLGCFQFLAVRNKLS